MCQTIVLADDPEDRPKDLISLIGEPDLVTEVARSPRSLEDPHCYCSKPESVNC